ncbi:hypothetical protein OX283_007120 [Flavobacterium sp. SUN052]|uniref:hypothetical protein n=1 Tax=Flavobacterium sp. SUN052 TaxID=3002441 RepID=UPI00237DF4C5|nr:hypothetical protein [Flavobacterium sp. SUN052]MEC4004421.1 hypothetical protein [Flavobacterium sp. SUN052]
MKPFLKKIGIFFIVLLLGFAITLISTKILVANWFDFSISKEKNILILGDSHTQCALNDTIISNALNMSESADTYFYSYTKLKNIIPSNKQIDTLILGYAPNNLSVTQDNWLVDSSINGFKLPLHFFLFDKNDTTEFLSNAPFQLVQNVPFIIKNNLGHLYRIKKKEKINHFGIGGFLALSHVDTTQEKKEIVDENVHKEVKFGSKDIVYLQKIYSLCEKNKIKLILLDTPIEQKLHAEPSVFYNKYLEFKNSNLPNATLLDYSKIPFDKKDFADKDHLNANGARLFSLWFVKQLYN